jgi:hypothetical protein
MWWINTTENGKVFQLKFTMRWLWWNYIVVDQANDLVVVTRWMDG